MMANRALVASNPNAALVPEEKLLDRYNRDYRCLVADTPELQLKAFQTRYQVYCVENEFENPLEHRGYETDEFDAKSAHCILNYTPTGETLGTVRLILPERGMLGSFSMRQLLLLSHGRCPAPLNSTAEVSRFSISKRARTHTAHPLGNVHHLADRRSTGARAEPLMSLGLIQGLVRMSQEHGITHWCAVMEPKLLRMLAAMGIHFRPVGPLIEYHGLRQVCYCELDTMLKDVKEERPTFWDVITDNGKLTPARHS